MEEKNKINSKYYYIVYDYDITIFKNNNKFITYINTYPIKPEIIIQYIRFE